MAFVARKDPRVITVQRHTVVRIGIVVLVLAALGAGTAIGLTVGSKSQTPTTSSSHNASTSSAPASTTTSAPSTTTTVSAVPVVLSCGPGLMPHVRPTALTIGCATQAVQAVTVTGITWSAWGAEIGGQGTGTLNQGFLRVPAVVVVFHVVNGVFQDVSVTPTKGVSSTSTPSTTSKPSGGTSTSTSLPTTTTTAGGIAPIAASHPGTGWGGS